MTNVILPKWGMGIDEGTVTRWLKSAGERVKEGEPIVEIETAKATQEVESPSTGILVQILVSEGQVAPVNTALGVIEDDSG